MFTLKTLIIINYWGTEWPEQTKASGGMLTVASSNLGHGRHFSPADTCLEREASIPRLGMTDIYGCPNQKFCCKKNLQYPPTQYHRLMTLVVEDLLV